MTKPSLIIYCDCAHYDLVPGDVKSQVFAAIEASGVEFEAVPDLCRMAAEGDPKLKDWVKADSLRIFACYPRAVRWLFHVGGAPLPEDGVQIVNMRTAPVEEIVASLPKGEAAGEARSRIQPQEKGDWIPWFPVIDYDRCENCGRCFDFCLFGVYEISGDDRVAVRNPANCKTNCPACAKACPQSAIIFPKYPASPINGDKVDEQAAQDGLAELSGGDIYDAIRKRSAGKSVGGAELREKLDIPPEVLASLSQEDMARISEAAHKKDRPSTHDGSAEAGKESRDNE